MEKYQLVRLKLIEDGIVSEDELFEPERASPEVILLVHTPEYFHAMRDGTIDPKAMRRIGECSKTLKCERQVLLGPQFLGSCGFCEGLHFAGMLVYYALYSRPIDANRFHYQPGDRVSTSRCCRMTDIVNGVAINASVGSV